MRKHRFPDGLKVARFPGMSEVSGSIPVSGLCFLLIFVVFTLCLPCYSSLLSACTVNRGALSTAWCSVHGLVPYSFLTLIGRAPPALYLRSYNIVHLCVLIVG